MKKLLLLVCCICVCSSSLYAQQFVDQGTKIAYVDSTRKQIFTVKADSAPKVIFQSVNVGTLAEVRVSHLAVLASTNDGKSLLIAGVFHFYNNNDDSKDSMQAFLRLDEPFVLKPGRVPLDRKSIGGHKVLYEIPTVLEQPGFIDIRKPLPIGTLSPNGQEWYGHFAKNGAAPNSFEFYHGKFDGSGTVDKITLPDGHNDLPGNEYHMTNICTDDAGYMICVVMDRLTQESDQLRAKLWRWHPSFSGPQLSDLSEMRQLRPTHHVDSSFVCLLRIIPGTEQAEIGLMPNDVGNIQFYTFRYTGGSVDFGNLNGRTIPRRVLPDSVFFFTGITNAPEGPNDGGKETQGSNMRHVNAGDMMFSQTGDSVVFIVSNALTPANSADWYTSPQRSGIWIYNIEEEWEKAKFVYNDKTKCERQPIFMGQIWKEAPPPPPGTINVSQTSLDFGTVKVTGFDKTLGVTITNPGPNVSSITSFEISGPQELMFFNMGTTPVMTTPFNLATGEGVTLNIKFDPSAVGIANATLTVRFANGDSSRTVSLTGVGEADGAVDPADLSTFAVSVRPNPMQTSATIAVEYDGREDLTFSLVDVLGREYKLNDMPQNFSGADAASFEYALDGHKAGLVPGSYTLFVRNGERTIARQIVVVGN